MLTYEKILADIKRQNYVEAPLAISKIGLEKSAQAFIDFLGLDQVIQDKFTIMIDKEDRGSNAGYVRKHKSKGDSDNKEYFHYRGLTEKLLRGVIEEYKANFKIQNFLVLSKKVFEAGLETLSSIISVIDQRHKGIYDKIFKRNPERFICLRFVKYDVAGDCEFLATPHYDRGSCALAMAESAPGLRIGKNEQDIKEVLRNGNMAIFMPAFTFHRDIESEDFTPAWHDVVQKSADTYSENIARWAIVLFADVSSGGSISYEEAHTPT